MLFGIYSLLSAALFVSLDAVDVAFTEAAVGAGISTILMLGALSLTNNIQKPTTIRRRLISLAVVLPLGLLLIFGISDLPSFASPDSPVFQHVYPRYIFDSMEEIGVPNVVTSVLASYRGYDTLGEVTVIFTATVAVAAILGLGKSPHDESSGELHHHVVLAVNAKLLFPIILLFGLYVQFHGDFGPGGGFQAGVIFAAAFILYGLVFGMKRLSQAAPTRYIRIFSAAGLSLYIGVGIASLLLGGNFLDYDVLATDPVAGQHLGILLIELGVGITVAASMIALFYAYANYDHE